MSIGRSRRYTLTGNSQASNFLHQFVTVFAVLLSRSKNGRHRPAPAAETELLAPDAELDNYLAALAPEADVETTATGRRFGNAEVHQLRLSLIANEQLRELAAQRQTSPMALAQEWVMQRLDWEFRQQAH